MSRVLNNHAAVREQTRLRVLAAARELGYRPNLAAKALATGRSRTLGVLAQDSLLYGPACVQTAFTRAAEAAGFAVTVACTDSTEVASIEASLERLLDQRVAGIAVIAPVRTRYEALSAVPDPLPLVLVGGVPPRGRSIATVDQFQGARLATKHLLDLGHATIWHITGPAEWIDSQGRAAGWRAALESSGAQVPPVLPSDWTARGGYEAGRTLAHVSDVTAAFAANDHIALGAIRALREHGRRVPDDVSVVGFDDVPEAGFFLPPLTTVRQDFAALARDALELLVDQLRGGEPGASRTVTPDLVVRSSSARAPAEGLSR